MNGNSGLTGPAVRLDLATGLLHGEGVITSEKRVGNLEGIFRDEAARREMDPETLVYSVQAHMPVGEGTPGGLFFGNTIIFPGKVGNEYFMTRGHYHKHLDRAEYYWCLKGEGMLILMDEERQTGTEVMTPGSLHYIPGKVAHRVANTSDRELVFNACWPSDAGHDYESIHSQGFSARLVEIDGNPVLKGA